MGAISCGRVFPMSVRIISYNVAGLPKEITWRRHLYGERFQNIADKLNQRQLDRPDVIGLQEVFTSEAKGLLNALNYRFRKDGPAPISISSIFDSGLAILSDHPLSMLGVIRFNGDCAGTDCFAGKGAMAVRVEPQDGRPPFVVVNTHLNAQHENESVRIGQVDQIFTWLGGLGLNHEMVYFIGDLNFRPTYMSYAEFMKQAGEKHLNFIDAGKVAKENPQVSIRAEGRAKLDDIFDHNHDRQFFATNNAQYDVKPREVRRSLADDFSGLSLSDHWAYEVDYIVTPKGDL